MHAMRGWILVSAGVAACGGGDGGGPDASLDAIEPWADAYGVYGVTLTETVRTVDARSETTCAGGCADTEVHWFETLEEYNAFDASSLCAP